MKRNLLLLLFTVFIYLSVTAKVNLPALVGDNMVLQQKTVVNLWGAADVNKEIVIKTSWDNKSHTAYSDINGDWTLQINTPIAGGPYQITLDDGELTKISNILIGEVWLCSGQSNMEMQMTGFDRQPVDGALDVILKARKQTNIRMFTVKKNTSTTPLKSCEGGWRENTPQNVANASATAYFFAQYLNEIINVPIGIIISSWGGTKVQSWVSEEVISPFNIDLKHLGKPFSENDRSRQHKPCALYNGMISPLINYTIKGMIWYQGESDVPNPVFYENIMPEFVKGLRRDFNVGDFPFYYVQITPYSYKEKAKGRAATLREVQAKLMTQIPNCGMAVTLDIGDSTCIHSAEKRKVGQRLAYWALAKTYNSNPFACSGPVYNSIKIEGNQVYVLFDNARKGVAPIERELRGFEVAGDDKVFYPAQARVDAKRGLLVMYSDNVAKPVAVRYGYKDFVVGSLYDVFGLPAHPFRSDKW